MILCRVTGSIVATHKNEHLSGNRLLVVNSVDLEGNLTDIELVALDLVDAGEDDLVLVVKEGGSARIAFDNPEIPLQTFIVAVVDDIEVQPAVLNEKWPMESTK